MSAAQARRYALRWARYVGRFPAPPYRKELGNFWRGHATAYTQYVHTGRAAPHGIRVPWQPLATGLRRPR